jgi:hypothetical protein
MYTRPSDLRYIAPVTEKVTSNNKESNIGQEIAYTSRENVQSLVSEYLTISQNVPRHSNLLTYLIKLRQLHALHVSNQE